MNKKDLTRALMDFVGGKPFISKNQLSRCVGRKDTWAYEIVKGLDKLPGEVKGDKYFIPDVVERIMRERRV